ncbi:60S ribosomal protein L36, putative [Theileria equi strain WA]|uniref:60S ribosomal protein L36, putative n=1 Tax=Theileria equi strain WA TaxID=1537102 RepID=L0B1U3_THEEQ|nr:60S ribosomal protein L36, putative [Theileria equi strain WA]AFZ81099.1 60S ribosomal protein L36, putative [Theileria equi strain WA]|eukprot:XP_004830765.1 60S ribosomal protein L36, putative [Theileria equi strain WA]
MTNNKVLKKKELASGISVGLLKGHTVTPIPLTRSVAPSRRKGLKTNRSTLVSEVIREVCGFAPYERNLIELVKIGSASTYKRAFKFAKRRLGTHRRAKAKMSEISSIVELQRKRRN